MSIILNNPTIQPALTFNLLHIDSFNMSQRRSNNTKREVAATAVTYALDPAGNKVYSSELKTVSTTDFDALAIGSYLSTHPGSTIPDAVTAYNTARTAVALKYAGGQLSTFDLMAYFEVALGHMFDITGAISFSNVN